MRKFREAQSRSQMTFLPPCLDQYVGENDLVRYVDTVIDELDLSEIEAAYSALGRPAYSPKILTKLIIYGKLRSLRSSRELQRAAAENVRFMFLCQNERPDFRTIASFRQRFHEKLAELLKQTIIIGIDQNIITLKHVAIDGTKIRAYAGRSSFKSKEKLVAKLKDIEEELKKSFAEDIQNEAVEDAEYENTDGEMCLSKELEQKERRVKKIQAAIKQYEEIEGKAPVGISTTDPEARFMPNHEGSNPAYNAQLAVDAESGMAVGALVTNSAADHRQFLPALDSVKENTGKYPAIVSADKGFFSAEAVLEAEARNIDAYLPAPVKTGGVISQRSFTYDPESDTYLCPGNRILTLERYKRAERSKVYMCQDCSWCRLKKECLKPGSQVRTIKISDALPQVKVMEAKVASNVGKEILKMRASSVEPAFGCIKWTRKLRQFTVKGSKRVQADWLLELAAHNVWKVANVFKARDLRA